ncbi:hypothetical protein MUK42_36572 [Musa troglodytarum]|uniref:Uncharacterized protein n=1 Tax=Musa troglodytarum TaxID=320322 RepID=A0A9E7FNM7_9LILI|nr:hypothetical protein MUK42_36572 [Musa troglodytarum]
MPVICLKKGIKIAMTRWGLYLRWMMMSRGRRAAFDTLPAAMMSSSSAWTSSVPRIFRSISVAFWRELVRWIILLGVSGRNRVPNAKIVAGIIANPIEIRHPKSEWIF